MRFAGLRWILIAVIAGAGAAVPAAYARPDDALLPIPGLLRPKPKRSAQDDDVSNKAASSTVKGGCQAEPLPSVRERLPFGPGEILSWDVALLGMRTGKVNIRLGERTQIDGETVYPSYASARTSGFLSVLGELDGRMVSWLDPETQRPVRMVNRFVTDTLLAPKTLAREDAAFSVDAQVAGRLVYKTEGSESARKAKLSSSSDLLDVLSVIYYMRSRELVAGERFCFEIYHRRRLWRVQGSVGGTRMVTTPSLTRRARLLDGELKLVGGARGDPPRQVRAWVSDDDDRLPLLVETPDKLGMLEVKLDRWIPGRRLVKGAL